MPRPLWQGSRDALIGYENVVALVIGLLYMVGPFAVLWAVGAVVVYALNAVFWRRARTHVCVKVLKGACPPGAHSYTSAPIAWIFRHIGIRASRFDMCPRAVFWGFNHAVRGVGIACGLAHQAAATARMLAAKLSPTRNNFFTAIALAAPQGAATIVESSVFKNKKTGKLLSTNIFDLTAWECSFGAHGSMIRTLGWQVKP